MEISIGDMIDRFTILNLKLIHSKTKKDRKKYEEEINGYAAAIKAFVQSRRHTDDAMRIINKTKKDLFAVNELIWKLESDIRLGKEKKLGLKEVGKRALKIRNFNKIRIRIKNRLNLIYRSGYAEKKIDHASD